MKFKIAREKSGMSQQELAQALGVDQSTVCLWETGKTKPRAKLKNHYETILKWWSEDGSVRRQG